MISTIPVRPSLDWGFRFHLLSQSERDQFTAWMRRKKLQNIAWNVPTRTADHHRRMVQHNASLHRTYHGFAK